MIKVLRNGYNVMCHVHIVFHIGIHPDPNWVLQHVYFVCLHFPTSLKKCDSNDKIDHIWLNKIMRHSDIVWTLVMGIMADENMKIFLFYCTHITSFANNVQPCKQNYCCQHYLLFCHSFFVTLNSIIYCSCILSILSNKHCFALSEDSPSP